ncbi:metal dependent phosphohydrolase [Staphylothermus marinus F1]|uniref:Metal dependent phosphohydrolase n=1 Tax=Staphylothermus marinus (strain ATCC 43588 / DSM 3639 / JCM 9404 / F1) TaxID=399550 RepID=A3DKL4_STAMF|nr:HD domain-containing protein [Staphylothermus marinus]ABN69174.1 metal dependent phosphohydrolase [Staphylothermus marinus F1]
MSLINDDKTLTKYAGSTELGLLWSMPFNAQIRDVIYQYIDYVKGFEDSIIDSWPVQRLRYVYQLQTAHFVYPSATHTRFNHSLGVMHLSYKYMNQLLRSITKYSDRGTDKLREVLSKSREAVIAARILGLLHDIGHGPFSHAFDTYVYKNRDFLGYRLGNHELLGYIIYRDYLRDEIRKTITNHNDVLGVDVDFVIDILDESLKPPLGMKDHTDLVSKNIIRLDEFYVPRPDKAIHGIVRLVVRDYIYTSDIIDYLRRDSYFTGLPLGNINDEWLIRNTYLLEHHGLLVPAISTKAVDDLVRLLNARKMMYKNVYLHHVNIAFDETIGFLLNCLRDYIAGIIDKMLESSDNLRLYLSLTDYSIYGLLQMIMARGDIGNLCRDYRELARQSLENLFIHRKPAWKRLDTFIYDLRSARHIFSNRFGDIMQKAIRETIKREIAQELGAKGFSEEDVRVVIESISIYPSASREIIKYLLLAKLRDEKPIDVREENPDRFAEKNGLIPEALFIVYLNRNKYRKLIEEELNRARYIVIDILEDAIGGKIKEAPETS